MASPRQSIFREAMQVSPERIANLSDDELSALMVDLLRAQAHRCGSPLAEVRVNTDGKAKDDGCDGWTSKPAVEDEWLGKSNTCWQLKAGVAGQPARLKGEVDKQEPKRTLQSGGRLVLVSSGSTNGKKGEADRLDILTKEAAAAGVPTERIEVIGSERLAVWCNQNPAVAARWAGRPAGLWTIADWAGLEVHQVPWHAPDPVLKEIARQRSALDFENGPIQHLHIYGHPGVGKTRFALELCRDAPWSASVIYLQQASDMRLVELIDSAVADEAVRLVVVADEIQPDQLVPLRNAVERADGRIRLLTVGHCPTPEPTRIPSFLVGPLDREMATHVIKGWYPSMPVEHVDFVVRFAAGYVRLAKLAADAVAREAALEVRSLLGRTEIRAFLDGMLGDGDRRSLYVVAVLESVGWTGDVKGEGEAIARHLGLDWNDVRAKVDEFDRRFGIVPRGGRYRYISPTPLGIHLAVEAWTTFPDLLRSLPDVLPTDIAKESYYQRLSSMVSNPQAREYAREELKFFFRIEDFVDPRAVRRWSALSGSDPGKAAANFLRALESAVPEERLKIDGQARRHAVWTLVRLAWGSSSFHDSTKALALLAEAENESWANNATAEFVGRFQIFLGGTAVPYLERLAIVDELISSERAPLMSLAVKALTRVGERQVFRMGTDPVADALPEKEWRPSTMQENLDCVLAAVEKLTKLAGRGVTALEKDLVQAARDLAMMLREGPVRSSVSRLFVEMRSAYPDAREPLRRAIADVVYRERKYWKELSEKDVAEIEALHASFEDSSLPARLRQVIGESHWDTDELPDLLPLAQELVESPATLVEMWAWFASGDAADGWRFGEALAERDTQGKLLISMQSAGAAGGDLRILCGYVSATMKRRGNDWYDNWVLAQSHLPPRPLRMLFEVASRCGATPVVAQCLREVLLSEPVEPATVGLLSFGRWGEHLEANQLAELLRAMIDAGHEATAIAILEHRTRAKSGERNQWLSLALELVASPRLIRSRHMTSHYWKELALRYVDERPGDIASAIIREQGDRSEGTWFVEHSVAAHVLHACVERSPDEVWLALESQLSSKVRAYMFSIGFPRGILERLPSERVLAWVDADPDERASMVAKLATKNFESDDTLASRVVGAYGDREDVARAFFSEFVSGGWTGPVSAHWESLAASVEEVARRTRLPKLRLWAATTAADLKQMAERDRQREEEEHLRGR